MTDGTLIRVECHAGGRADESPRRLVFSDRTVEIVEIESRWRTPEGESFRLRGDNGVGYTLLQNPRTGSWRILAIDRPA